jgi:hypothetical protein
MKSRKRQEVRHDGFDEARWLGAKRFYRGTGLLKGSSEARWGSRPRAWRRWVARIGNAKAQG